MNLNYKLGFIVALLAGGVSVAAVAADKGDIRLLEQTSISLTQAIAAAENHQGGRASEASLDDDSFKPAYEVSVVVGERVFDVAVDGVSGAVIGAREDIDD